MLCGTTAFSLKLDVAVKYKEHLKSFCRDESGAEVIEYALIAGLIVAGAIVVIGHFGTKVLARWNSVNSSL